MQTVTWHEHEVHCAPPPAAISGAVTVAVGHKSTLASAGLAATVVRTQVATSASPISPYTCASFCGSASRQPTISWLVRAPPSPQSGLRRRR